MKRLSVAIQAGGESTRMGINKAMMDFLGEPLIARVITRVSSLSDDIFIITKEPQEFNKFSVRIIKDVIPGKGAIGGLYTALVEAKYEFVAVVACDMPFVNMDLLKKAYEVLLEYHADVAIPKTGEGYEPLHAVYRIQKCLPAIQNALATEKKRLVSWFPDVNVVEMKSNLIDQFDPEHTAFINVNTRDEYIRAIEIAKSR